MDNQIAPQEPITTPPPNFFSKLKIFLSANKFIIIFLTVLAMASFGTTGYLLTANKKANTISQIPLSLGPTPTETIPTEVPIPSVTPTPQPVFAIDPTATWSAFVSAKYAYSIKYPPNWTAKITTQEDTKILEYVVFNPVATKAGTLSITLSYGTRTYAQALALDPQTGEIIAVASASATKKSSKDSNNNKAINVIVPFGLNTIIFNAKDTYSVFFDQMLSTLTLTK